MKNRHSNLTPYPYNAQYGAHLMSGAPLGVVATKSGPLMAGIDNVDIHVQGVGGHGAMPHQTVDSIVVVANLVSQLQTIMSRNIDPMETGVLTIGTIQGGTAVNVVADEARVAGTLRYLTEEVRGKIHERIRGLWVHLIALLHGHSHLKTPVIDARDFRWHTTAQ